MNELALFSGIGGGILAGKLLGWRTVCAVEWNAYAASILIARQNDKFLEPFPIWDNCETFDGTRWRGIVDVVSGGFPCQDLSIAKQGGDGLDGERSGLWREMGRIIGEVRPRFVFVENSPMLVNNGLDRVLTDLSKLGFDARWDIMGADSVGAPHRRERFWLVANSRSNRLHDREVERNRVSKQEVYQDKFDKWDRVWSKTSRCVSLDDYKSIASEFLGMDDGIANRMDRIKACGNAQVPECAAFAWRTLNGRI